MATARKARWRRVLETIGHYQFIFLVGVLYFILTFPFALIMKLKRKEKPREGSYWYPKRLPDYTLENYREQGNPLA